MSVSSFTESVVEEATLLAGGSDYTQAVLEECLRQALARLNLALPPEALEDAFRKLARPEGTPPCGTRYCPSSTPASFAFLTPNLR